MERRAFGKTGLSLSALGYGCGAVGGLLVRGSAADQERAVARAIDAGVNYFDTAPVYGAGESERNLGRILKLLKPDVIVGTKINLLGEQKTRIGAEVRASLDASLQRLGRDHVDLVQLHNTIRWSEGDRMMPPEVVLDEVVPAFEALRRAGKTRFVGFTAVGDTKALQQLVDARVFDSAQVTFNLLNPSAAGALPAGYPGQDYGALLTRATAAGMGTIGIRVLAAGALSGVEARPALAQPKVDPIGSGPDYASDVARARAFQPLVEAGLATSLVDAAIRYAIACPHLTTVLVGTSSLDELDTALAAVARGPLPAEALARVAAIQQGFATA